MGTPEAADAFPVLLQTAEVGLYGGLGGILVHRESHTADGLTEDFQCVKINGQLVILRCISFTRG